MISIVTTWYHATETLPDFYRRVERALAGRPYELIWVFDGSSPGAAHGFNARVIALPEHRGECVARLAGLAAAQGEKVFVLPGDLEIAPEVLPEFEAALAEHEVVIGCQAQRRGDWLERLSGEAFYFVYNALARTRIPRNPAGCYLFTGEAARKLAEQASPRPLFVALVLEAKLRTKILLVDKTRRHAGEYGWRNRWRLALRALSSR